MEAVKTQLSEITNHFNTKMADFQKELKGAIPAASPSSNINSQFGAFRSFVLTALENLQLQVELLARQQDELEMRSRRKILLLHGVEEVDKEDPATYVSKLLSEHLGLPQISANCMSRCHRLGRTAGDKPRAVLLKFKELSHRDTVWFAKAKLKGSGLTLSEFLINSRHKTFLAARQRFGVAKCWTRDGNIMLMDSEGKQHRITTMSELNVIPTPNQAVSKPATVSVPAVEVSRDPKFTIPTRAKRTIKK